MREPARDFFIDNLLVRIHFIIVMIRWTGLAPWELEFPLPGSLTSSFLYESQMQPSPRESCSQNTPATKRLQPLVTPHTHNAPRPAPTHPHPPRGVRERSSGSTYIHPSHRLAERVARVGCVRGRVLVLQPLHRSDLPTTRHALQGYLTYKKTHPLRTLP